MEVNYINFKIYSLLILVFLAVYQDIKTYKIKNYIIIIGITTGLIINIKDVGFLGIYPSLLGIILPVVLLLPLFLIKVLGAGDIKLFSVIGLYVGKDVVLKIIALSFFIGAIISIFYLIRNKLFIKRLNHLKSYISNLKREKNLGMNKGETSLKDISIYPYYDKKTQGREGVIHFSIAILLALLVYIYMNISI